MKPSGPGGNRRAAPALAPWLGLPVSRWATSAVARSRGPARSPSRTSGPGSSYCRGGMAPCRGPGRRRGVGRPRERLDRLAERVKATGARAVVVYHFDRFARDLAATFDSFRRFSRRGVELHVVGRGRVEADTATGFIVTAVEGLAAEHYRRVIREKTRDALARLRANGRRVLAWPPTATGWPPDAGWSSTRGSRLSSARSWCCGTGGSRSARSRALWRPEASWPGTDARSVPRPCLESFATGRLRTQRERPERDSNPCLPSATRFFNPIGQLDDVDSTPHLPPDLNSARILFPCRLPPRSRGRLGLMN